MVAALKFEGRNEQTVQLRFGGGVHSRASEDEINLAECAAGQNFLLDLENREFRNRPPIDQLGMTPNASEIRGFAQLLKADGSSSMLVQAGPTVYEWNGTSFSSVGSVDAAARLRGRLEHNWQLDDKVIITDLNLRHPVLEWDGTTLKTVAHNLTGSFLAKYCFVANERAHFGNVVSNSTATPHMLVGSKRGDFTNLSTNDRPSSALNDEDPFFLLAPDLRPINGLVEAFNNVVLSSKSGSMYKLQGSSARDFIIDELFPLSGASGDESVAYIGNDIVYGRQGRIESVLATDRFGDVQSDDITVPIQDLINGFKSWCTVYNSRLQRVYFFPTDVSEVWVYHKDLVKSDLSPWAQWKTQHSSGFQPTAVMNMFDPLDGLEYVFFGDAQGNLYRLEGAGASGDAGSAGIQTERLSALFAAPADASVYDLEGYIKYRKNEAVTVKMTFEYAGEAVFDESITIEIPGVTGRPVYGEGVYYGGDYYYGTPFAGRLTRQKLEVAGSSTEFQIRLSVEGSTSFEIQEIGLRFEAAS